MTSEDRTYFMLRAQQERSAARSSANRIVRGRHEELAWLYEMRVQFADRSDTHEAFRFGTDDIHEPIEQIHVAA